MLKPLTVWITTNWKILKQMGIPDHLTFLLSNVYAGQEATVRTGHGTIDWFKIWKGVNQGCISSPCLFNLYKELLLLSHFSCVRLCATPQTAAHQAPPSLGFSRQEHWSGLPFPSPMYESEKSKWNHVQLLATPWTAAHQAPPSMGFSRQEYWSGVPLPSPRGGILPSFLTDAQWGGGPQSYASHSYK